MELLLKLHDQGKIKDWFSWVEAVTLTALLFSLGGKSGFISLKILGFVSLILVWAWTVFSITKIPKNLVADKFPNWLIYVILIPLSGAASIAAIYVLGNALDAIVLHA